ncbi:hypothetical protein PMIN06_003449 [Paraphaeosphaeria minitans]
MLHIWVLLGDRRLVGFHVDKSEDPILHKFVFTQGVLFSMASGVSRARAPSALQLGFLRTVAVAPVQTLSASKPNLRPPGRVTRDKDPSARAPGNVSSVFKAVNSLVQWRRSLLGRQVSRCSHAKDHRKPVGTRRSSSGYAFLLHIFHGIRGSLRPCFPSPKI